MSQRKDETREQYLARKREMEKARMSRPEAKARKRATNELWAQNNPERLRKIHIAAVKRWRKRHPEAVRANKRAQYARSSKDPAWVEKANAKTRAWRQAHPDCARASVAKSMRKHLIEYRPTRRAKTAKRRAAKICRTPDWADLSAIRGFYETAPIGCVVDHILPLQGKTVSGLHVLENLQYLTASENSRKQNRYEVAA